MVQEIHFAKMFIRRFKAKTGKHSFVCVDSKKFKEWNKVGYVSQKANSFNSGFPATVFEVVSMGLVSKRAVSLFTKTIRKR